MGDEVDRERSDGDRGRPACRRAGEVWEVITDLERFPDVLSGVRRVERLDDGDGFAVGTVGARLLGATLGRLFLPATRKALRRDLDDIAAAVTRPTAS